MLSCMLSMLATLAAHISALMLALGIAIKSTPLVVASGTVTLLLCVLAVIACIYAGKDEDLLLEAPSGASFIVGYG
jgi:hypothetical protein